MGVRANANSKCYDPTAQTCLEWSPQEASGKIHPLGTRSDHTRARCPRRWRQAEVQCNYSAVGYHAGSARTARAAAAGLKMGLP